MSRDWLAPHGNAAFCNGQGGWVGYEMKEANVTPQYTWLDGTSSVCNVGEQISPNADGTYTMASASGAAFDGKPKGPGGFFILQGFLGWESVVA